jgi:hypothetical protein
MVVMSGRDLATLPGWIAEFRGITRPVEDLSQYLLEEHGIAIGSLEAEASRVSIESRAVVQEVWHEAHGRRRERAIDPDTRARLVAHDVENYLGVVGRRKGEVAGTYGHKSWWLTLDHVAYDVGTALHEAFGHNAPDSPVMSPDFMVSYLAVGPLRAKLTRDLESRLPLSVAELPGEAVPELIHEAQQVRQELQGMSDRLIRREVRDRLDRFRRRKGRYAVGGLARVEADLGEDLAAGSHD